MIKKFILVALLIAVGYASNCNHITLYNYTNGYTSGVISSGFEDTAAEFAYSCNGNHTENYDDYSIYGPVPAVLHETRDHGQYTLRHDGCKVLSLYCGFKDAANTDPVREDTLFIGYSNSKGVLRGLVLPMAWDEKDSFEWDDQMSKFIPGFASGASMTVEDVVSNGAPGVQRFWEYLNLTDISATNFNHEKVRRLCRQTNLTASVGSLYGYSTVNIGFQIEELLINSTGKNVSQWLDVINEEIGTNFKIGIRPWETDAWSKVGIIRFYSGEDPVRTDPNFQTWFCLTFDCTGSFFPRFDTVQGASYYSMFGVTGAEGNSFSTSNLNIPAAGIFMSGDDLSKVWSIGANQGRLVNQKVVSKKSMKKAVEFVTNTTDYIYTGVTRSFTRSGLFGESPDHHPSYYPDSFGHYGVSGAFGFALPSCKGAVGYVTGHYSSGSTYQQYPPRSLRLARAATKALCDYNNNH